MRAVLLGSARHGRGRSAQAARGKESPDETRAGVPAPHLHQPNSQAANQKHSLIIVLVPEVQGGLPDGQE